MPPRVTSISFRAPGSFSFSSPISAVFLIRQLTNRSAIAVALSQEFSSIDTRKQILSKQHQPIRRDLDLSLGASCAPLNNSDAPSMFDNMRSRARSETPTILDQGFQALRLAPRGEQFRTILEIGFRTSKLL